MKHLPSPSTVSAAEPISKRKPWSPHLPKLMPKNFAYIAGAVVIGLILVWAFRPAPMQVDVGTVERGLLQVTVEAEGKTRVRDRFTLAAPVSGQLERITLEEGDLVQAGMPVARIDSLPQTAAVQEALGRLAEWRAQRAGVATQRPKSATLAQAQARIQQTVADRSQAEARVSQTSAALQQAQRERTRALQLATQGAISRQDRESAELAATTRAKELEAARLAAKAAADEVVVARNALTVLEKEQTDPDYLLRVYDARIASTEAELAKLRDDASRTVIRAPAAGRVLRVRQKSAQFVSEGMPLLEVGDIAKLELEIDVLSSDAEQIKPGNLILIERTNAAPLRAKVQRLEPAAFTKVSALGVEEQRVNVIGTWVDPPTTLGDAYRVDTKIVIWEGRDVLKVPLSALYRCERQWCTFVVEANRAQQRRIAIHHRSSLEAEVKAGLRVGEQVILHSAQDLKSGQAVNVNP